MFATPANFRSRTHSQNPWAVAPASVRDTILIVEDEDPIAGLLTCILERGGFRVRRARDARDGARQFADCAEDVALALLDCTLPDVNGVAVCAQLRARCAGLPVLFVSGRDLGKAAQALTADGPTGFCAKPFLPAEILRQVRALIGATV